MEQYCLASQSYAELWAEATTNGWSVLNSEASGKTDKMTQQGGTAEGWWAMGACWGTGVGNREGHRPAQQLQGKLGAVPGPDVRCMFPQAPSFTL